MARPRDRSIDRAVIDACVELLDEVGRHRLSREQIARRAGVSLPAVNRRFASVDDILVAVASTPPHDPYELKGVDSLRSFLVASLTRTARTFAASRVRRSASELLAAAAGDERIEKALQTTLADLRTQGLAWVEQARERGEIGSDVDGETLLDLAVLPPALARRDDRRARGGAPGRSDPRGSGPEANGRRVSVIGAPLALARSPPIRTPGGSSTGCPSQQHWAPAHALSPSTSPGSPRRPVRETHLRRVVR